MSRSQAGNGRELGWSTAAAALFACAAFGLPASAVAKPRPAFQSLYSFTGGNDGGWPMSNLTADAAGNLYGVAIAGGPDDAGVVFKLAPDGTETVIYSFTGGDDGATPEGALVFDKAGNLYGTTAAGGANGLGTVYKIDPSGKQTVLLAFAGANGASPFAGLIIDADGNLYGTTPAGGANNKGAVFELAANGTETVLHSFAGTDGNQPYGPLLRDAAGNLYGTTLSGGAYNGGVSGAGTVYKITKKGVEKVVYSFLGQTDGWAPESGLIRDKAGNLYGTTTNGGAYEWGSVFKIAPDGSKTTLYSFTGYTDGGVPIFGLLRDASGNLYGTTAHGGTMGGDGGQLGNGVVFKLAPDGTESVLYSFTGGADGSSPYSGLITNKGVGGPYIYGVTMVGGSGDSGTVFRVKK